MVEQVLIVHSDSTDGTAQIASQMGAEVSHERRGAAMIGRAHRTAAVNALLERDYSERPAKMFRLLVPQHCHRRGVLCKPPRAAIRSVPRYLVYPDCRKYTPAARVAAVSHVDEDQ
jgi:hypothetical protein